MKNKTVIYITMTLLCLIVLPQKVEAQRRGRVKVKRSRVFVKKRGHVRPIRARRVAHYRYKGMPRWGRTVRTVGIGHVGIRFDGIHYRYHKGIWYRPKGKRFIVAKAPFGVRARLLPNGHRRLVVGANTYFYYYGTYYTKIQNSEKYEVIEAPIGAEVDALPDGYEVVKINDIEYYKFECTYYEPRINEKNEEYYVVVQCPMPK